jgi:hypothetical protein
MGAAGGDVSNNLLRQSTIQHDSLETDHRVWKRRVDEMQKGSPTPDHWPVF